MELSPAAYVIYIFGGVRATSRLLGRTPPTVSRWQNMARAGLIPARYHVQILRIAKEKNKPISAHNLVYGGVI